MSPFFQKTVVITGAASGIGRALAIEMAKAGCHLALADVNLKGLEETMEIIPSGKQNTRIYEVDVSDKQQVYEFAEQVIDEFKGVQIVINNAGVSMNSPVSLVNYDDFEWVMNINFWGMVYGTKAFLPHLLAQKKSWLANVSSIFGVLGIPTQSTYNASKFAIRGFTEALRQEAHGSSLTVTCVHPGGVKTNIARLGKYEESYVNEAERQILIDNFDRVARTNPQKAAQIIINGMVKGKKRILVGIDAKILDLIARTFPAGYDWFIAKFGGDVFNA